ncbi:fungal-specific transcription factor domain-containing protein [Mariannaea sp. PMI_226]|nr:fungal-specific transcription factor domain-containing protein [Mariannaea sp. PMI_226]
MEHLPQDQGPLRKLEAVREEDASDRPQKFPSAKVNKKRASRACLPCRSRKVRCIVTGSNEPCINCRLDEKECVFMARSRIVRSASRQTTNVNKANLQTTSPSQDDPETLEEVHVASAVDESALVLGDSIPADVDPPELADNLHDYDYGALDSPPIPSTHPDAVVLDSPWPPSARPPQLLSDPTNPDYSILEAPKIQSLSAEDLDYLCRQGCFVVPHRSILDEFVQQYFLHIHPMLPMLNEADFWALYLPHQSEDTPSEKISLIVLQGMLFAACSYISRSTITALGFSSVHDAKSSFYKRAKLLYDFGLENSSISISQAALLLSHSHLIPLPHNGCKQLGPMWLGIAIHYARDAGAHRYHSISSDPLHTPSQKQANEISVLKRLWWCCVIRDRLMPLTSRRTIKITPSNFNFSRSPLLVGADLLAEADKSRVYDPSTKRFLAEVMAKLIELCIILTEVLTLTFSMYDDPPRGQTQAVSEENRTGDCRLALRRWYGTVVRLRSIQGGDIVTESETAGSPKNSIVLFINLLEMYYHSARMALCQYELLEYSLSVQSNYHLRTVAETHESSTELYSAVTQLTQCLRRLVRLRLARWLPISAVGCTAFPLALQILDVRIFNATHTPTREPSNVPLFAQHKQQQLNVLIEAMKTYRPRYDGVDWVAKSVRYIVDVAQKHLPILESQSENTIASWTDILQLYPNYFLRLAMTMDLSIRNGKIPQETDFPQCLRGNFEGKPLAASMSLMSLPSLGVDIRRGIDQLQKKESLHEYQHHHVNPASSQAAVAGGMDEDTGGNFKESQIHSQESPSTTPRTSEFGIDPLILELGFEAGILSPLVDMEFTGISHTSPSQWTNGISSFEAEYMGVGNEHEQAESLLDICT